MFRKGDIVLVVSAHVAYTKSIGKVGKITKVIGSGFEVKGKDLDDYVHRDDIQSVKNGYQPKLI